MPKTATPRKAKTKTYSAPPKSKKSSGGGSGFPYLPDPKLTGMPVKDTTAYKDGGAVKRKKGYKK
jgi:hypothetical protein